MPESHPRPWNESETDRAARELHEQGEREERDSMLEPFAAARRETFALNDVQAATLSQAISLKRIADALEAVTCHLYDEPAVRTRESR